MTSSLEPLLPNDVAHYEASGVLVSPPLVEPDLLRSLRSESTRGTASTPVFERDGATPRSFYGGHRTDPSIDQLCRHPLLLGAAKQLLGGDVYVHQFKINVKQAFVGDVWDWHQDFTYWQIEDGIRAPSLTNCVVFLDTVSEFNAPLTFIPGSHSSTIEPVSDRDERQPDAPGWTGTLTSREKYALPRSIVRDLADANGLVAPKGDPGTVVFFHPNVVHASSTNLSPFDRTLAIIVYNRVDNPPTRVNPDRPPFLSATDHEPLEVR